MTESQTIFRVACRHKPYSQLGNAMLRDKRLSIEARGGLAMILSHPVDWKFSMTWFRRETGLGRDKSQSVMRELAREGYAKRRELRGSDGRVCGTEYLFSDEPAELEGEVIELTSQPEKPAVGPEPENPVLGAHRMPEEPVPGEPAPGNPATTKKERNKEGKYKENPPVVPRGGRARVLKSALPDDWQLPQDWHHWAKAEKPAHASRIGEEAAKFADHWRATGKRMVDWKAAWRNWWRRACERPAPKSNLSAFGRVSLAAVAKPGMTKDQIIRDRDRAEDELDRPLRAPIDPVTEEPKVYRADTPEFNARITQLIANGEHAEAERIQQRGFLKEYPSKAVGLLTASLVSRGASHLRSENSGSRGA